MKVRMLVSASVLALCLSTGPAWSADHSWKVVSPGVIEMTDAPISIHQSSIRTASGEDGLLENVYIVNYKGQHRTWAFTLDSAKDEAERIASELKEMGMIDAER